jgi:hypothetical protein
MVVQRSRLEAAKPRTNEALLLHLIPPIMAVLSGHDFGGEPEVTPVVGGWGPLLPAEPLNQVDRSDDYEIPTAASGRSLETLAQWSCK